MNGARQLLEQLDAGYDADGLAAALAFVAAQDLAIPEDELAAARRRAVFVLAAGGDPHRKLEPDARAVRTLAEDLDTNERRADLSAALDRLREHAAGLDGVIAVLDCLRVDPDVAWRWLACALLAEEISDEGDDRRGL